MLHYLDKRIILIFSLLLMMHQITAQELSNKDKRRWSKADKSFEYGDYINAFKAYRNLVIKDSNNLEINYNLGVCFFKLKRSKSQAKKYLHKVKSPKYKEVSYYLGKLHHLDREYEEAIYKFKTYKDIKGNKRHSDDEVDDLISKCRTAAFLENTVDKTIQIKNLGETVNSIYAEYSPLISLEDNKLFFTSRRKNVLWDRKDPFGDYYENIFYSENHNGKWGSPKVLDTVINSDFHDACTGISADGKKILIYRTSKDGKSGSIYESNFFGATWLTPQLLNKNVNSLEYAETSACYSADGNTIFFSSNRPGGLGGQDLYCVKKLPNGSWGKPYNLGPNINTKYNEHSPFVHPSEKVLFFSSEGHINMGGYDVFKSNYDESGAFGSPMNMGYPINTVDDDVFFVMNAAGSLGYLSSARDGGYGSHDLYKVSFSENKLPENLYKISVYDESNNILKNIDMRLVNVKSNKIHGLYKPNVRDGKIIVISEANIEYEISIKSQGYNDFVTRFILKKENHLTFTLTKKNVE